ncbi:TolC family protein [Dechloromonas sp. A34]|uniref:TolC family protein n=1 Tax=Dechloromonas sp. A34 TaxID=447588 RepID=UPI0022488587|nr:TolC family protein [Dechloromonas sp. A34]
MLSNNYCGRFARFTAAVVLSAVALGTRAAEPPLTLERAWQLAEEANPTLKAAQASLSAAEGQLTDARGLLWNNPQLAAERARRKVPQPGLGNDVQREWRAEISQTLEIAGQHGYRRGAAEQDLSAFKATVEETRREVRAEVAQKFVRVLGLQARTTMEAELVGLIRDAAGAAKKRFEAGEDTRLDANLAEVELGRAENQLEAAREQLIQARAKLATTLQLPAEALPEVQGALSSEAGVPYTLEQLQAVAADRPLLRALDHHEQAARSRLGLERAAVYPDVTVGLFAGREGPGDVRERITGLSVSLPLPLFRRNAAGIGRASTELTQTQIERQAALRDTRATVLAVWQRLDSLRARVQRLEQVVLQRLQENQRLSTTAYRAGEINLTQLLLATRQVLDTRREVLEAMTDLALTRVELEQAAGWSREKAQ